MEELGNKTHRESRAGYVINGIRSLIQRFMVNVRPVHEAQVFSEGTVQQHDMNDIQHQAMALYCTEAADRDGHVEHIVL
jgi:hypothetical protein